MPKRIQMRRKAGWRKPEGAVYVGRPSKWGNEFPVGQVCEQSVGGTTHSFTVTSRQQAVNLFCWHQAESLEADARAELAGKDLSCWCPLDLLCHADVLLELANRGGDTGPTLRPGTAPGPETSDHAPPTPSHQGEPEPMSSTADTIREAAATIEAAVQAQRRVAPDHVAFHDIARAVERTTATLHDLATDLRDGLALYGRGRRLRTDIDRSPAEVLEEAVDHSDALRGALDDARTAADLLATCCGRLASAQAQSDS